MKGLVLLLSLFIINVNAYEMQRVNSSISFVDDLDFKNLNLAIERQLRSFQAEDMSKIVKMGSDEFTKADMKKSLLFFQKVVNKAIACLEVEPRDTCYANLNLVLNQNFMIYKPIPLEWEAGHGTNQTQFTAYYSPDLHGKLKPDHEYKHAIYALPKEPKLRRLTRVEIDFDKKLKGRGLELVYVKESLYDIWLLHVEGGGRVQIEKEDGSIEYRYLSYHDSNKQPFQFLYKYMISAGMLKPGEASVFNQRRYLDENPHHQREVFASSPSYIFFKFTKDEPLGVRNIPLTENRSLATDYRIYNDYGFINFISAQRPILRNNRIEMIDFSRFFLNQDTGGAIKGQARCDLYFGFGEYASLVANSLKVLGNQYFLMLDPNLL
jgi:membrane-bound lytic murein transglycosylase A